MLYPIKFKRHIVPKVWGGKDFNNVLGLELDDSENLGELWEVSAHPNGMSYVLNGDLKGMSLKEIFDKYKDELVTDMNLTRFPLLIKYLDVGDRLSIQVHPNNEMAKKLGELGKSECWYIIYASDDAKLALGVKDGIDKEEFLKRASENDFMSMFETYSVKTGDLIDITPGLVHASVEGTVVLSEIQQSSDVTYRIYDFDRLDHGKLRPLHIEEAAEAIVYDMKPEIRNVKELEGRILKSNFYTIDKMNIQGKVNDSSKVSFVVYMATSGSGKIANLDIKKGETILVPLNYTVELEGDMEILRITME